MCIQIFESDFLWIYLRVWPTPVAMPVVSPGCGVNWLLHGRDSLIHLYTFVSQEDGIFPPGMTKKQNIQLLHFPLFHCSHPLLLFCPCQAFLVSLILMLHMAKLTSYSWGHRLGDLAPYKIALDSWSFVSSLSFALFLIWLMPLHSVNWAKWSNQVPLINITREYQSLPTLPWTQKHDLGYWSHHCIQYSFQAMKVFDLHAISDGLNALWALSEGKPGM